ncbi:RING-type domain-containing protein [Mycena kentingensis (nom. inval.)]|nr:RING-type domain-containing protein [Mycena kentingensis (nom. inval.)]
MPVAQAFRQGVVQSITSHRILIYSLVSLLAVVATIANALTTQTNFFSIAIYLSKSSRSVLVLANFSFLVALFGAHVVQKIFFGALRPSEVERLYDRLWFFITESLLAFTIFRDEFDIAFVVMFGFLLFVKSFHWIAADRVEWMDQRPYPGPPLLFHVRMTTLFLVLWTTDLLLFMIAVDTRQVISIRCNRALIIVQYGILMATVANTVSKYLLCAYELRRAGQRGGENAPPWENKSMWVFYIELVTDFLKLSTYMIFFTIIMTYYGIPLNILRDVYVTGRSLITRLRSLQRYQTATRNMDQRYPNATPEEMAALSDHTCIICREEMVLPLAPDPADPAPTPPPPQDGPNTTPKKLPCGHIFHFNCLRSWLERQQSCPTCRRNVLETTPQPTAAPAAQGGAANVPGQPNPNNGNANNPGLVGHLFPPGQPGGPQAGQLPPNVVVQNHPNGQGGFVIEYHIQYQAQQQQQQQPPPPNNQPPNNQPPNNQPLQPVPQFRGFPGPAGAWQPWPNAQDAAQPAAPTNEATETTSPQPTPTVAVGPEPTSTIPDPQPTTAAAPSPREAAALAALRRFNGSQGATRPNEETPAPRTVPSPSLEIPAPSSSTPPAVAGNLPTLIPLHSSFARSPLGPQTRIRPRGYSPRGPIPQLPPTLTEEQLATMDSLTREAIDERLRVLEGVSGAVHRCIDDLMRMRSVLPARMPQEQPTEEAAE